MRELRSFLAPHMQAFMRFRKASERWHADYEDDIFAFDRHCADNYPDAARLEQEMVDGWCRKRDTESNNACWNRTNAIVGLVRYMRERGLTDVADPERPKKERDTHVPYALSEEELQRFFSACDTVPVKIPNKVTLTQKLTVPVFFRLLYSSGMRPIEARELAVGDVNLGEGVVDIKRSKGYDQHFVVLHDTMLELMRRYDDAIRKLYPQRAYFFPADANKHHTRQWVDNNFRQAWDRANNSPGAIPYDLRHHYAIENINSWVGLGLSFDDKLLQLQRSMGHASQESTKRYFALVPLMYDILEELSGDSMDWILPEVDYEEAY